MAFDEGLILTNHHSMYRAAALILLAGGALVPQALSGQDEGADSPTGWKRFVEPVLENAEPGVVYFPAAYSGNVPTDVLDPRGFTVHMTNPDAPGEEVVFPAGQTFIPPGGRWRIWLQGEWSMSPSSSLVIHPPTRAWEGVEADVLPRMRQIGPAGRVTVPAELEPASEVRLLAAGTDPSEHELSRRRPVGEALVGVLMPAGPVLAGAWDPQRKRYLALSRPFDVAAGETVPAPLERPAPGTSQLVAYVEHPRGAGTGSHAGLALTVSTGDERLPPDVTVITAWGVHAFWYGLPPGTAVLGGGNTELYLEPQAFEMAGGEIEHFEGILTRRPLLDVTLVLPPRLRERPFTLEVRKLPEGETLAKAELPRKAGRHRFHDELVKGVLEVVLDTHAGRFRRQIDLTTEEEGFLALEPELIELFGTVHHASEPHAATVRFKTVAGDDVEAKADEAGTYEAVALQPLGWVEIELAGVEQAPWRDFFAPPLRESRELDFEVPDAEVAVRVVDAVTREGIAGAVVSVRNEYLPPVEPGGEEDADRSGRERVIAQSHAADENGLVRLPPPRPGTVEIGASADDYQRIERPLVLEIPDPPQDREVEIALQPFGERVEVHLTLPDGSPATGAEVLHFDPASSSEPLYSGRADASGVVRVPVEPRSGLLLLKHPRTAFGILDWSRLANQDRVEWAFPPAAEIPLSVQVLDPSGEEPAFGAEVSLWVGERRLSGFVLRWLSGSRPSTDRNGFWIAERLPRTSVRLLATLRGVRDEPYGGALDALATEVSFPWPDKVKLEAVR